MFPQQQSHSSLRSNNNDFAGGDQNEHNSANFIRCEASASHLPSRVCAPNEEAPESEDTGATLDETARKEQEYLRQRLREELKREPSEEELNEWLRQHTEGY